MGQKKKKYPAIDLNELKPEVKESDPIQPEKIKEVKKKKCTHKKYDSAFCPDCEIEKIFEIDTRMQKMLKDNDFELAIYQNSKKTKKK